MEMISCSNMFNFKTTFCFMLLSYSCTSFQTNYAVRTAFTRTSSICTLLSSSDKDNKITSDRDLNGHERRSFLRDVAISGGVILQGMITQPEKSNALLPSKLGGLSNKIRRVSLIMVRYRDIVTS